MTPSRATDSTAVRVEARHAGCMIGLIAIGALVASCDTSPQASSRADAVESQSAPVVAVPSHSPTSDDDALQAWCAEAARHIEHLTGRRFAQEVPVRIASKDDLAAILAEAIEVDIARSQPDMHPTRRHVRAMHEAYQVAGRTAGLYNRPRKSVLVVPEHARALISGDDADPSEIERVLRLTVAHELVHALQDQHVSADTMFRHVHNDDSMLAVQCVIEGHAVVVTDALAQQLGWTDANERLWRATGGRATDFASRVRGSSQAEVVYVMGRRLLRSEIARTGPEAAWSLLADPPRSLREVRDRAHGGERR